MPKWLEAAMPVRAAMDAAGLMLDEKQASTVVDIYPRMQYDGKLINAGSRIKWNETVMVARTALWDREENNPDNAPTLWEAIMYKDGYRMIPEVITAENAFSLGECGWWNGELYESLLTANVWTPEAYPEGWKKV